MISEVEPLKTGDGNGLKSFTFFPKGKGNWKQVRRDVLSGSQKVLREGEPVVFELGKKSGRFRAVYVRRVAKGIF